MIPPPTSSSAVVSVFALEPRKLGSLEEFAVFLSRALHKCGWQSILVFSGPLGRRVLPHFAGSGAVIELCRFDTKLHFYVDLVRVIRKYSCKIVHFHFVDVFSLAPVVAWLAGADLVVFTDHNRTSHAFGLLTRLKLRLWDRLVLAPLRIRVVAISNFIQQTLVGSHQMATRRVNIVHNGVNLERFCSRTPQELSELRRELGIEVDRRIVVSAAYLIPEKGISVLLCAAKLVLAKNPDVVFVIVGDGPLEKELRQQAQQLRIAKNVRFTGLRSDVNCLMASANIVAAPSVWQEPAGLVVIEAMASARPIVASRVGGIPEYLADGVTGILVEPSNPEQLANAIARLLNSPAEAEAMGRAGRMRVEMLFSMDRWVRDTLNIYEMSSRGAAEV